MNDNRRKLSLRSASSQLLSLLLFIGLALSWLTDTAHAQARTGRLEGRLVRTEGSGVSGVSGATVILEPTGATTMTGTNGQFSFGHVPAGTYSVTLTQGPHTVKILDVVVTAGATRTLEQTVEWVVGFTYRLVVQTPSRQGERFVEAPAATTAVEEVEIESKAATSEVPKLIEFTPGAQVARGGLWDFNLGTRGFNRALSRRVAVILDGHDLSLPFFGYQGWPAFSFPLDDLARLEFVRGPSAALYGANASGGVISMTSKEPKFSLGAMARVTFGELNTVNAEGRWAGLLGHGWYARSVGGMRRSQGFAVSRVNGPEYSVACAPGTFGDCLPAEVVQFDGEDTTIMFGQVRFDKYFRNDLLLTIEAGHAQGAFGVFQAVAQRAKSLTNDGKKPWARLSLGGNRFKVAATYDWYREPGYIGLGTGRPFASNSYRVQLEGQTNRRFRQDRVQLVAGATATIEKMNSDDPAVGGQTFLFRPITSYTQAVFAQVGWTVAKRVKIALAARGEASSLYDFQVSPRGSVTFAVTPHQSLRATYSRAFQVSNSLEYFLNAAVAPPTDLTALNGFCTPFGVDCKFGSTPVLAVGNEDLEVETVRTLEAGYKGVFADRVLLTLDYYRSHSTNLVTSLLPQLGTALGRLNPRFGAWSAPAGLPNGITDQIRTAVPLLSNAYDGSNILAVASYTNFKEASTQGIDAGLSWLLPSGWRPRFAYSWFGFHVPAGSPSTQGLLLPNTPAHAMSAGLSYDGRRIGASLDVRWVDDFRWADGFFLGDVKSYATVDLAATYLFSPHVSVHLNIANLLNNRHWETFGGALLRRRALASLQYRW